MVDYVLAHMFFNLAASQQTDKDRKKSVKRRNDLEKKMQAIDVRKAQRMAREWKPKSSGSPRKVKYPSSPEESKRKL